MNIVFARHIVRDIKKLDRTVQIRIKKKLLWFASQKNPLDFAEVITDSEAGHYHFRIGHYRIIFDVMDKHIIFVNAIGHRRDIYK